MKKLLFGLIMSVCATLAHADYRFIVPQAPGGGTSVWATIVAKELEKKLGEKIIIEHIPGANDIPGFNKFHNELRKDPKVVMVAHGGNAESYLVHPVDYNYSEYAPVGLMNLDIIVGRRTDFKSPVRFSAGSGMNPDVMAITLLECGSLPNLEAYKKCYNEKIVYVEGMKGNDRRLSFMRGELNTTRETTAAFNKHVVPMIEKREAEVWFKHGILDLKTGKPTDDVNFKGKLFADVYRARWGKEPSGDFYNAYLLVKSYRDVLQKSLWVDKNNPNREKLIKALRDMLADPVAVAEIEKDTGKYPWIIGDDVNGAMKQLDSLLTAKALKDLVWWNTQILTQRAVYKDDLVKNRR